MYTVFEPVRLGPLDARNRIIRSATWLGLAGPEGEVTGRLLERYAELGRGGAGIVVTGYAAVSPEGRQNPGMLGIWDDRHGGGLAVLAGAIRAAGTLAGIQLVHAGGQTRSQWIGGKSPLAPSFLDHPQFPEMPRELSAAEIERIVRDFGAAARRARQAGFDLVQLHAAHGYLINQFLSPGTNQRRDRYGGSLRARFRFLQEVVAAVQAEAGPDFPVAVKLNGADFLPGGLEVDEAAQVAAWLCERGIVFVEVSGGTRASGLEYGPIRTGIRPGRGEAYFRDLARRIRHAASCPVAAVGGLRRVETLEEMLMMGEADLFALSRPLIREPDLPARWAAGDRSPARCVSCNRCFEPGRRGEGVYCVAAREERAGG